MADIEEGRLKPVDPTQFERGRKVAEALVLKHQGIDLGVQSEKDVICFISTAVNVDRREGVCRRRLRLQQDLKKTYARRKGQGDRRRA